MASIKEIAKLAAVSAGTASFVLNGKGDQMRISKSTQERVLAAAKELGYLPNISAKRLRSKGDKVIPVIAILWTIDTRTALISRFLQGVHERFRNSEQEFEVLIEPYESSKLHQLQSLITGTRFNGAIIANASDEDLAYLENHKISVPVVLYQRKSKTYSTVSVDSYEAGSKVADLFQSRGHKRVGMIVPQISSQAVQLRQEGFVHTCASLGLELLQQCKVTGSFSEEGGYESAKQLLGRKELPSAIFVLSDQMATGALTALHEAGVRVPEDIEIVGHDNNENTKFTIPSLTTVHLPVEEMADACISTIIELIEDQQKSPIATSFKTNFVFRKSCGSFQ
ncbi:LacI family DNA-binding transcriptional regulator [Fictibacillus enclensis]|uniref:LacI family DNA-binding transcriptional regulator n=1 Tax=Fictibacillus enclensis TaxID=1017270 RepID=UPI0025A2AF8A|nr:LacI family DNA-binding transcriptional regulator [Fictibacillus enclensis]MDM5336406.1 LacI family DNA-binding transcriptional regulator [Fictibacillus enclensis]